MPFGVCNSTEGSRGRVYSLWVLRLVLRSITRRILSIGAYDTRLLEGRTDGNRAQDNVSLRRVRLILAILVLESSVISTSSAVNVRSVVSTKYNLYRLFYDLEERAN